jgi:hypothetical protein
MSAINNVSGLAKELAKREGKKKQVDIAQLTEMLGHLSDIIFEQIRFSDRSGELISQILYKNGSRRSKKKI